MPRRPTVAPDASGDPESDNVVIPLIDADPISYLGPGPMEVEFAGQLWTLRSLTAADWLEVLWSQPFVLDDVFPGLLDDPELEEALSEALFDADFDLGEVSATATDMIEVASGLRWWFTLRLCSTVRASWSRVGGMLVLAGVDPQRVALGAWCVAVLSVLAENMRPKDYAQMLDELNAVPEGFEGSEQEQMEMDEAEFMAFANAPY